MSRTPVAEQALVDIATLRSYIQRPKPSAVLVGECASYALNGQSPNASSLARVSGIPSTIILPMLNAYERHGLVTTPPEAPGKRSVGPPSRRFTPASGLAAFMLHYNHLFGDEIRANLGQDVTLDDLVARGLHSIASAHAIVLRPADTTQERLQQLEADTSLHSQTVVYRSLGLVAAAYGVERQVTHAINAAAREYEAA